MIQYKFCFLSLSKLEYYSQEFNSRRVRMQFTKYGVTLHNSYLSMLFTDFKAALKSLAVEMPNLAPTVFVISRYHCQQGSTKRVLRYVKEIFLKRFENRTIVVFFVFLSCTIYLQNYRGSTIEYYFGCFFFTFSSSRFKKRNA